MKTGKRWSYWKAGAAWLMLGAAALLNGAGCVKDREAVEKNLLADRSARRSEAVDERYRACSPDVLELRVPERPEFSGRYEIGPDGKIDLADYGRLRLEGHTLSEIARLVAAEVGVAAEKVQARVVDFRGSYILIFGEIAGQQRSVPYRGQETVLDLLRRVGGITVGAEPDDIHVVRPHLADNVRPEVFHVDLRAIVVKHDEKTNLCVLPFDQIYVGATRQATIENALPPWLRRVYQAVWDTRPDPARANRPDESAPSRWVDGQTELAPLRDR